MFGITNLVFQQNFAHRETYISNVLNQFDMDKYNLLIAMSIDVNKDHFISQNDQLFELVLKYHILVSLRTLLHFANYVCNDINKLKYI